MTADRGRVSAGRRDGHRGMGPFLGVPGSWSDRARSAAAETGRPKAARQAGSGSWRPAASDAGNSARVIRTGRLESTATAAV
ncbi:hypothetical protein GCM10022225_38810 [Plantactinospora mayteni]